MDFGEMLKQARKLQENMAKLQEELSQKTVTAQTGGGMVCAVVGGNLSLVSLTIEKDILNPTDAEMLQDLVVSAVNEGLLRAKEMARSEMAKLTGGITGLPGIPDLF